MAPPSPPSPPPPRPASSRSCYDASMIDDDAVFATLFLNKIMLITSTASLFFIAPNYHSSTNFLSFFLRFTLNRRGRGKSKHRELTTGAINTIRLAKRRDLSPLETTSDRAEVAPVHLPIKRILSPGLMPAVSLVAMPQPPSSPDKNHPPRYYLIIPT